MNEVNSPNVATPKERFELLLAATSKFQERFVDSGFKIAAALTVFLGWLLTASSAQQFLKGAPFALWACCVLVGLIGSSVVLFALFQARREADEIFAKLRDTQYMDEAYLVQYKLKPRLFWCVTLLVGVICALLLGGMLVVRIAA